MGLDNFTDDSGDNNSSSSSWEDDMESSEVGEHEFPSIAQIAAILKHHSAKQGVDVTVEDGTLEGDIEEVAMLYAHMFLDHDESDPYSLEDPR